MDIINKFSLKGKVAIITGTRQGLGQGMAIALASAGADIIGFDRTLEQVETRTEIEKYGRKFNVIKCDMLNTSVDELKKMVEEANLIHGHIDILVNNAGIIRREDSQNFTELDWDEVMTVNLKNLFFLSQAVANKYIEQQTGGKIISIASMLSYQGGIRVPSYCASKAGVKGITMTMCNEWAKYNINVNAIAPGYMSTSNTKSLRDDEERHASIIERIPAARWGTSEDMMGAVVFLASSASDYVNGFTLAVDGGWLAR